MAKSLDTTNRYPSIAELVCFVSEAAREVTDLVFGVSKIPRLRPLRSNMMSAVCVEAVTA